MVNEKSIRKCGKLPPDIVLKKPVVPCRKKNVFVAFMYYYDISKMFYKNAKIYKAFCTKKRQTSNENLLIG